MQEEEKKALPDSAPAESDEARYKEIQQAIALDGDYSKLTPDQRAFLLLYLCRIHGLDPSTRPFSYIKMVDKRTGKYKTVLYAHKAATDGIAKNLKLADESLEIVEMAKGEVIYKLTVVDQEWLSSGGKKGIRKTCVGAVPPGLNGLELANAHKKAETQAHRRAILAIACPGVMDESEIEDVPGVKIEEEEGDPLENAKPAEKPKPKAIPADPSRVPASFGKFSTKAKADPAPAKKKVKL